MTQIITIIRDLTDCSNSVQIAATLGAATYNTQGSTIHRLLKIDGNSPSTKFSGRKEDMLVQLKRLSVLVTDEMSQINFSLLAGTEHNTMQCIYKDSNTKEYWGGLPVVLLFGDDYQLLPVAGLGVINGYADRNGKHINTRTRKGNHERLVDPKGKLMFIHNMTEMFLN